MPIRDNVGPTLRAISPSPMLCSHDAAITLTLGIDTDRSTVALKQFATAAESLRSAKTPASALLSKRQGEETTLFSCMKMLEKSRCRSSLNFGLARVAI